MSQTCTYCGDPAISICKRLHLEWIIVLPREIKSGDIWKQPEREPLFLISKVSKRPSEDCVYIETRQGPRFRIPTLTLPVIVKRRVPCGWPRCELHCGKCLLYAEAEQRRDKLLGVAI